MSKVKCFVFFASKKQQSHVSIPVTTHGTANIGYMKYLQEDRIMFDVTWSSCEGWINTDILCLSFPKGLMFGLELVSALCRHISTAPENPKTK